MMTELSRSAVFGPDLAGPIEADDPNASKLSIAEMSESFGVTLRALRFYEEKGLLRPDSGRRQALGGRAVLRERRVFGPNG